MADQTLQDELIRLLTSSLSFASLDPDKQALLKERLLALSDDDMLKVVQVLRKEQREQYASMKGLVDQITQATANLKKSFLKEKEKNARQDEKQATDDLLRQIDDEK